MLTWWRKSAAQGFAPAQNQLGTMYENNIGVPQNYKRAATYYRLAANQHDPIQLSDAYKIKGKNRKAAEAMEEAYLNVNDTKSAVAIKSAFNQKGMYGVWEWWLRQQEGLAKKQYVPHLGPCLSICRTAGQRADTERTGRSVQRTIAAAGVLTEKTCF